MFRTDTDLHTRAAVASVAHDQSKGITACAQLVTSLSCALFPKKKQQLWPRNELCIQGHSHEAVNHTLRGAAWVFGGVACTRVCPCTHRTSDAACSDWRFGHWLAKRQANTPQALVKPGPFTTPPGTESAGWCKKRGFRPA